MPDLHTAHANPLQRLADARRVLAIPAELASHPFVGPEGRLAIRHARHVAWTVLAEVVEQLVETLDIAAGDPDLEPNGDDEPTGDELDASWAEGANDIRKRWSSSEDDEESDEPEDDDPDSCAAGDDRGTADGGVDDGLPGSPDDSEDGHDDEREQMQDDVPCVPVYAMEPSLFSGKREFLGLNNLQPSFRSNGRAIQTYGADDPPEAA